MRRILIVLAGFVVLSNTESRVGAQTASASLTVSASVSKNCTITTAPVSFGAYDPVTVNSTTPLDGVGTITVTCTKGAAAKVGLNAGGYPLGNGRRMFGGADAFLTYELYKDAGHANIWGNTSNDALDLGAAPNKNPRNFTVYGRVAQSQDATVGNYADTVLATVNF